MKRPSLALLGMLLFATLVMPLAAARAQQAGKVRVIGWLGLAFSTPEVDRVMEHFRDGLRNAGWVEGQNLTIERRWAQGRAERLPELAAELLSRNVELIVTNCGPQIAAIRRASQTIPIVISACSDLLSGAFVASLARPGGQMTGSILQSVDLSGKRLQLYKELMPKLSRVAVMMAAVTSYDYRPVLQEMQTVGKRVGVEVPDVFEVRAPDDFDATLAAIAQRADSLIVLADPMTFVHRRQLIEAAMKHRLPVMFEIKEYLDLGGLLSYGPRITDMFRRAAYFVDRILKGARPADLPVEQPSQFELVINMKTAKALGLTIPASVLARADQLIE
jgi:putative ABC transport system substrate-binding protein